MLLLMVLVPAPLLTLVLAQAFAPVFVFVPARTESPM